MAPQVKVLVAKLDDLSSISGLHVVLKRLPTNCSSNLHVCTVHRVIKLNIIEKRFPNTQCGPGQPAPPLGERSPHPNVAQRAAGERNTSPGKKRVKGENAKW